MASQFDEIFSETAMPVLFEQHGVSATYYPASGGTVAVTVMGGVETTIDRNDMEGGRTAERTTSWEMSTDPTGPYGGVAAPGMNDQIDVDGVKYEVRSAKDKSGDLVTLECVRIGSIEKARPGYRGRR